MRAKLKKLSPMLYIYTTHIYIPDGMKTFKIYFSLAGRSIQGFMYVFSGIINKSEISSRFL